MLLVLQNAVRRFTSKFTGLACAARKDTSKIARWIQLKTLIGTRTQTVRNQNSDCSDVLDDDCALELHMHVSHIRPA